MLAKPSQGHGFSLQHLINRVWWHVPTVQGVGEGSRKDQKFKVVLSYINNLKSQSRICKPLPRGKKGGREREKER